MRHWIILIKSLKRLPWSALRSTSQTSRKETTSSGSIRWSTKQRCVITGSCSESVSSKILALSHMANMSCKKRSICLTIIRLNFAPSFTPHPTVPTETDASSYIPNTIFLAQKLSIILSSSMKTLDSHMKELFK